MPSQPDMQPNFRYVLAEFNTQLLLWRRFKKVEFTAGGWTGRFTQGLIPLHIKSFSFILDFISINHGAVLFLERQAYYATYVCHSTSDPKSRKIGLRLIDCYDITMKVHHTSSVRELCKSAKNKYTMTQRKTEAATNQLNMVYIVKCVIFAQHHERQWRLT